jgi:transporter family protein
MGQAVRLCSFLEIRIDKLWVLQIIGAMWFVYALLSAVFAAFTSILAKAGIQNINSNLATAIRTIVVLIMSWLIVFISGKHTDIINLNHKSLFFLILSGIATGLSWLCYYKALQIGEVSKVMPVDKISLVFGMVLAFFVLKETLTVKTIIGGALITLGTIVFVF